ncbi:MAG TPA: nuclear transport factor 2 family protein [Acidimicrobiia bacterium]|nr:nuclear transport factor 2 family protein [Acidimicrobiia bacterium]
MSEPDELTREFTQLYQDWFARVGPDPGDFFERVLSTDWVYIDYLGKVRGKADYEPYVAAVPPERVPTHVGNLGVRRFGDLAIVHGSYEAPGGRDDVDRTLWFTAVWIHRQGRWQALAHHTSAVAA